MNTESALVELGAHSNMSVDEALQLTRRESNLSEVLILGYRKGTDDFTVRSSGMKRADALWLLKQAELSVLDL